MASSKSSKKWLQERARDKYVKKSKQAGFRSRASFKLLEIQEKDRFIKPGMVVVDLGCAPGGWSQAAKSLVGDKGSVLATDILPMAPISGVKFIQGDFTDDAVFEDLIEKVQSESVDLVISDMAPNITGIRAIDQPGSMHLAELALDFARSILREGAYFLVKVFEGDGIGEFKQILANEFEKVKVHRSLRRGLAVDAENVEDLVVDVLFAEERVLLHPCPQRARQSIGPELADENELQEARDFVVVPGKVPRLWALVCQPRVPFVLVGLHIRAELLQGFEFLACVRSGPGNVRAPRGHVGVERRGTQALLAEDQKAAFISVELVDTQEHLECDGGGEEQLVHVKQAPPREVEHLIGDGGNQVLHPCLKIHLNLGRGLAGALLLVTADEPLVSGTQQHLRRAELEKAALAARGRLLHVLRHV